MSRHLANCAGDDYCFGDCRYDGIPQRAILMRASDVFCSCEEMAEHRSNCTDTPAFWATIRSLDFNPFDGLQKLPRFWDIWRCMIHGYLGDINGPVHLAICDGIWIKAGNVHVYRRRYPHAEMDHLGPRIGE